MCITLKAVDSILRATPTVEYEQFSTPKLVIQPDAERMIPPKWVRLYFDRLGCEKTFAEIPNCGHWTPFPTQLDFAVDAMVDWFEQRGQVEIHSDACRHPKAHVRGNRVERPGHF